MPAQPSSLASLVSLVRSFRRAEDGNIAIMFAIALVPIVGLIGFAVDYSRISALKAKLQAAADMAALAAKTTAATNPDGVDQTVKDYFNGATKGLTGVTVDSVGGSYAKSTGGATIAVSATVTVQNSFLGVLGFGSEALSIGAHSTWGGAKLRVALVLDNTGSMASSGKIDALKTATNRLLSQLKSAAVTSGDVYVSIIPFSTDVNLDSSNSNATWIDWTDWEANAPSAPSSSVGPGSTCPWNSGWTTNQCLSGPASTTKVNTVPSSGYICPSFTGGSLSNSNKSVYYNGCYDSVQNTSSCTGSNCSCSGHSNCGCTGTGSSKVCTWPNGTYSHTWTPNPHSTWNGCVTDRGARSGPSPSAAGTGYDQKVDLPGSTAASKFPAEQYSNCTAASLGLKDVLNTTDWTAMTSLVTNMSPNGSTNQPIGLVWAWQTLVGGGPFTSPAYIADNLYTPIIILLSDGLNTQNRWSGNGSATATAVDKRMYDSSSSGKGTCANIKNSPITINGNETNIVVYTVQVNTGGDPTSTLLQNCASSEDTEPKGQKFFLLTSADQIISTFDAIGTKLSKLRVSQ